MSFIEDFFSATKDIAVGFSALPTSFLIPQINGMFEKQANARSNIDTMLKLGVIAAGAPLTGFMPALGMIGSVFNPGINKTSLITSIVGQYLDKKKEHKSFRDSVREQLLKGITRHKPVQDSLFDKSKTFIKFIPDRVISNSYISGANLGLGKAKANSFSIYPDKNKMLSQKRKNENLVKINTSNNFKMESFPSVKPLGAEFKIENQTN